MRKLIPGVVLMTTLFFAGCSKEDGTTDTRVAYSFSATNMAAGLGTTGTASGTVVTPLSNGSITWSSATVNVSKIEFSATRAGSAIALESKDMYSVNALKPDSLAGSFNLSSGVYENVKFKFTMSESATRPPLVLSGTYTETSGTKIPVTVQLTQGQSFGIEVPRVEIQPGNYVAKVTLELNKLAIGLTTTDFGQTTRATNNAIIVNATTNKALYEKLAARVSSVATVSVSKQ